MLWCGRLRECAVGVGFYLVEKIDISCNRQLFWFALFSAEPIDFNMVTLIKPIWLERGCARVHVNNHYFEMRIDLRAFYEIENGNWFAYRFNFNAISSTPLIVSRRRIFGFLIHIASAKQKIVLIPMLLYWTISIEFGCDFIPAFLWSNVNGCQCKLSNRKMPSTPYILCGRFTYLVAVDCVLFGSCEFHVNRLPALNWIWFI